MTEDARQPVDLEALDVLPDPQPPLGPETVLRLHVIRQQALLDQQAGLLAERTAQIALLADRLSASDARIGDLIAEVQALQREATDLRAEVAALRASNSWRITGPGRALRRTSWWLGGQSRTLWVRFWRKRI